MRLKDGWGVLVRHRAAVLSGVVLLGLGLWSAPRVLFGPEVAVERVHRADFVQSVVASGHVETPHRTSLGAQIVGTVRRVPVAEGQSVAAGQVLIELDRTELEAAVREADLAVQQARARLRQLGELQVPVAEQALRQAEVTRDNARTQLRRNQDLFRQGFIGEAALDDAQKAADLAEAQLRTAQAQLESARPQGSDYVLAQAALAQAEAAAASARVRLGYATIAAPVAGTLIERAVEPGDVVQPGKALMVLSPAGRTQLVVQIDEKNLHLLALGQSAQASADAYANRRFPATLAYINPGVDVQRGSVEVKLDVPEPPDYLTQDMTVSVDIQVARRAQAVLVASDAVRDPDTGHPWVLAVENGRARRREVKLGLHSGGLSEIAAGLQPGDLVVPSAVPGIADGDRLRAVVAETAP